MGSLKVLAALTVAALLLSPDTTAGDRSVIAGAHRLGTTDENRPKAVSPREASSRTAPASTGVRSKTDHFTVFSRPRASADRRRITASNPIDQRLVMLVRGRREVSGNRWYEVLLPGRPNGSSGWVRAAAVNLVTLQQRIRIDLSKHSLVHLKGGEQVGRYSVAIGAPGTPTPRGTFYIWARVPQPSAQGAYGVYALGLSGFSVLSDWPGGGRAAIHGTADPTDAGTDVSHGCIRVPNSDMKELMRVPMGTPVTINA